MHKIRKFILSAAVIASGLPVMASQTVTAMAKNSYSDLYSMQCPAFEVDTVNDQGGFDKSECYDSFSDAKQAMKLLGNDAVVRHGESYSPSKIIAMNAGIAYSYPVRSGKVILDVNQYKGTKTTYMEKHRELTYWETDSYDGDGTGNIHATVTGFEGTVELKDIDLIPYKFITSDLAIYLGGNDVTSENEAPFYTKVRQSYYTVEQNGNYKDLVFHAYSGWAVNGNVPALKVNTAVGPAASWMNVGDVYYSYNDYDFFKDREYQQYVNTYYNYYEFLPLRTQSSIPASAYNTFLSTNGYGENSVLWNHGDVFAEIQEKYGMNGLLVFAQACLESRFGTSSYAVNRYNLFGWNAVDSDPNKASYFKSVDQCVQEQAAINLRKYLDTDNVNFFGSHFGNKGSGINVKYASTPYYGLSIAGLLYKFDKTYNSYDGNLTEFNEIRTGVVNEYATPVLASENGTKLYSTEYGATYQENYTVAILDESDHWYKVQSTNYLDGTKKRTDFGNGFVTYDWNTDVGYISKDKVTVISAGPLQETLSDPIGKAVVNVYNLNVRKGPATTFASDGYAEDGVDLDVYAIEEAGGYTWYQIGINRWIASKDSWVTYTAKDTEPEETPVTTPEASKEPEPETTATPEPTPLTTPTPAPTPETTPTPIPTPVATATPEPTAVPTEAPAPDETADPEEDDSREDDTSLVVFSSLQSIAYTDDSRNVIHVEGRAIIEGLNSDEDSDMHHQLVLTDLNTGKETVIDAETFVTSNPIDLYDGNKYTKIGYKADVDLDTLTGSNYTMRIRVINGEAQNSASLNSNRISALEEREVEGKTVRVYPNSIYGNRFEISKETAAYDSSLINKPSKRFSARSVKNLTLKDGILSFDGYAYIYNAKMTEDVNPKFTVILADEEGNITEYGASTEACLVDYQAMLGLKYGTDHACYSFDMNLKDLQKGTYRMYIRIETDEYLDIEELYNYRFTNVNDYKDPSTGKTFHIETTDVHSRYELTVTE